MASKNRFGRPWGVGGVGDHLLVLFDSVPMRYHARFHGLLVSSRQVEHQSASELAERVLGVKRTIRVSRQEV